MANSSFVMARLAPSRSTINPPEWVSTARRIQSRDHRGGVDPDATAFHGIMVTDRSLTNFGARGARGFHFAPCARHKFRKASGDRGRRVGLAIAFDRGAKQLRHSPQNINRAVFGVAAQTNHRREYQDRVPKRPWPVHTRTNIVPGSQHRSRNRNIRPDRAGPK